MPWRYLWKEIGTSCIHLPQTHEMIKLFRDILEMVEPAGLLMTETNVPHDENITYFGNGDEAHLVYQFSLPPLLLHAILQRKYDLPQTLGAVSRTDGAAGQLHFLQFHCLA